MLRLFIVIYSSAIVVGDPYPLIIGRMCQRNNIAGYAVCYIIGELISRTVKFAQSVLESDP